MAFTVRELSENAETNLIRLLDNNKSILKTKTKAIDYVLRNHYNNENHIKEIESKLSKLQNEYHIKNDELIDLKKSIRFVIDSINK